MLLCPDCGKRLTRYRMEYTGPPPSWEEGYRCRKGCGRIRVPVPTTGIFASHAPFTPEQLEIYQQNLRDEQSISIMHADSSPKHD
jgi:hypothetical protein